MISLTFSPNVGSDPAVGLYSSVSLESATGKEATWK
jgi:hypothetical protein